MTGLDKFRLTRLLWLQLFKRSPINLRKFFWVEKGPNPQAIGLFLSSYIRIYKTLPEEKTLEIIKALYQTLENIESKGWSGSCWGYNFDWQARAFFQPAFTPTVIPTVYAGHGILDYYELTKENGLLEKAHSICLFLLKDLNRTYLPDGNFAFSYSPKDQSVVFNVTLHVANFLARMYKYSKDRNYLDTATKAVEYCIRYQNEDGSWPYGSLRYHQWKDSFHTGYNLECLSGYERYSGDNRFSKNIKKGLEYYVQTFFDEEGRPAYYHNKKYPYDINSVAQLVVTVCKLGAVSQHGELINKLLNWSFDNLWSEKGYFYYRKTRYYAIRVPYMRWSQAWMFYALQLYIDEQSNG